VRAPRGGILNGDGGGDGVVVPGHRLRLVPGPGAAPGRRGGMIRGEGGWGNILDLGSTRISQNIFSNEWDVSKRERNQ